MKAVREPHLRYGESWEINGCFHPVPRDEAPRPETEPRGESALAFIFEGVYVQTITT